MNRLALVTLVCPALMVTGEARALGGVVPIAAVDEIVMLGGVPKPKVRMLWVGEDVFVFDTAPNKEYEPAIDNGVSAFGDYILGCTPY